MKRPKALVDTQPFIIACAVTLLVAVATGTPYFYPIPEKNIALITQAQTTLYNGWMIVLTWYFGSSKNAATAQDTMNKQAETARQAGAALAKSVNTSDTVTLKPGDTATVTPTDAGTTIDKETPP